MFLLGKFHGRCRPDAVELGLGLRYPRDGRVFVRKRRGRQQRPAQLFPALRRLFRQAGDRQGASPLRRQPRPQRRRRQDAAGQGQRTGRRGPQGGGGHFAIARRMDGAARERQAEKVRIGGGGEHGTERGPGNGTRVPGEAAAGFLPHVPVDDAGVRPEGQSRSDQEDDPLRPARSVGGHELLVRGQEQLYHSAGRSYSNRFGQ